MKLHGTGPQAAIPLYQMAKPLTVLRIPGRARMEPLLAFAPATLHRIA